MEKKVISTYGKHMVCPETISEKIIKDIMKTGMDDYKNYIFKHTEKKTDNITKFSSDELLKYIKESILNKSNPKKKPLLLLSDGKDSLCLAIAFNELNISCDTITFLKNDDNEMKSYLTKVTTKLGHNAHFITVNEIIQSLDMGEFKKSFKSMNNPVLDQGYIFFLFGLKLFFEKYKLSSSDYEVYDGMGNDEYLGHMPSKEQLQSFKFSKINLWKILPSNFKSYKWYIRSPIESHGLLSTLSCFFSFPYAYDLNKYFKGIKASLDKEHFLDLRAFSRGKYLDRQCMMGKTETAANYLFTNAVFPWLDNELSNYCFNIPVDEKLNFEELVNKVPLRKLLKNKISWNQDKRGVDLFLDLDEEFLKKFLTKEIPMVLIDRITFNKVLSTKVKKRAYLELLNFYLYCAVKENMTENEIKEILNG
ncbi:hypothetical protein ACH5BF_09880 [Arcobacter sp. YIC-464]|uniref:hypothetical protein n=1 Tax=Arcobacter sp. YIC-464 TaxID=3376631 RepID=UPI003C1C414C